MKAVVLLFIVLMTVSCANNNANYEACHCCQSTYSTIDSAFTCISANPIMNSTSDNRLLLFAFVNGEIKANQEKGWNIITDEEIVQIARRDYLLITIDKNSVLNPKNNLPPEFISVIKYYNEDLFYVITNQALYPFADWTADEDKDIIVDRLRVGNGP